MKKLASIIILCLSCMGILGAQNIWTPINVPGKIYGVAANGDIFANSYEDGILCRSLDGGQTWQPTFGSHWFYDPDAFMAISGHGRIFANPVDDDIFYSDDGGDHWTRQATSPGNWYPMTGLYAPTNDTLLYWGEGILAYTLDNGQIWDTANMDFITGNARISDVIANEAGDVYVSLYHNFQTEGVGVFHSTLSDMQNWELVAFEGIGVKKMEFDPEGNVLCGVYFGGEFSGFEHVPGFYAFWASSFGVSDNGIIYKLNTTANNTAVLAYSIDHGEHFTEIGEEITLEEPAPGGDDGFLFKGRDNRLYCYGNEQYYKSICNADYIYEQPAFAPMGAEWYFNLTSFMGSPYSYYRMAVEGDTIIEGHQCSIITRQFLGGNGDEQYVYEDDGVVYWYNQTLGRFTTLYDFNAEEGESWICDIDACSYEVTVQSVEEVTWEGRTYRVQNVAPIEGEFFYFYYGRIIEGIGSVEGLFPYPYACVGDMYDGPYPDYLRCYLVDGVMLYHGGEYDCDEIVEVPLPSYPFAVGDLLYEVISDNPPRVSVYGHVDGENAQGELVIPETVEYESITYTVTKIGYEAFYNCSGLMGNLVIPSTVDTIMTRAFKNCSGFIGNLVIPNSVRHLGGGAFEWCYGFDGTLVLPEGIPAIYSYTFEGCTGLSGTLNIPSTVTSIGPAAFGYCTGFTGTLVIPESVVELNTPVPPVNGIRGTFEECTGLTGLVLPESLRIIDGGSGGGCFASCTGLTGELVIPDKVKEIGYGAFYNCNGLTGELHLPDSLEYIGSEAFSGCTGFSGRLVFPDALETIDNEAFARCSGFSEVDLNHQVFYQNNFGDAVFAYWSMENVELPEGCTATGKYTFRGCGNLRTVHLPESLTKIDYDCFQECSSLTNIIIPESVTIIETGAFDGCISLTSMELPVNLSQLGGFALRNCTSLTGELVVPDLVERIEQLTFAGCTNLNRIVLGSSVNTINDNAFKDIVLDTLVIKAMTPPVMRHFPNQGLLLDQLVVVPCGTLEAYQNAEGWSDFTNIIEDCGSGLAGFNGAEWYYEIQNLNGSITYQHLEYAADTTINHKDVQIIIRTNTLYDKSEQVEVTREYIYEEDNVVYWWNKDLQEFTVLYNLDAEVGDEWEIKVGLENLIMHVDGVEQYYYDGRLFRMLRVSDDEDLFSGVIVCGIGHLTSFFPERLMNRGKNFRVEGMRCYWRNGELFFKYGEEDCDAIYKDYHFGLDEQEETVFAVYPNPTHNVLIVETQCFASQPIATEYRITNLMGQTLMSGQITAETQQIDVTNLPDGMYFITVGDATRKFVVR